MAFPALQDWRPLVGIPDVGVDADAHNRAAHHLHARLVQGNRGPFRGIARLRGEMQLPRAAPRSSGWRSRASPRPWQDQLVPNQAGRELLESELRCGSSIFLYF